MYDLYDDRIEVPTTHPLLSPFLTLIPIYLLSVGIAKKLRRDVDKPQNLAKSVTVE
jgi:glutamine---fructose-6-phosphate transaminase (isomerizing)